MAAQVAVLEPRRLLSSTLPAEIDQMVQDSDHPEAWYAALDVLLPAVVQVATDEATAYDAYTTQIDGLATQYVADVADLSDNRQASLQAANDTYWAAVNSAEQALTTAYNAALGTYSSTTGAAQQDYDDEIQALLDILNDALANLSGSSSGGGGSGDEVALWETMLTGEIAAWNAYVGIQHGAANDFGATMQTAVDAWTQTVDAAYVARETAFASIIASTNAQLVQLNSALETAVDAANAQFAGEVAQYTATWTTAVATAEQAWIATDNNPSAYPGFGWVGAQGVGAAAGNALGNLWNGIVNAPQAAFDAFESAGWGFWQLGSPIVQTVFGDMPVTDTLLDHSLNDNPPDLHFPAGHFIPKAIFNSSEFPPMVARILQIETPKGPGTYTDSIDVVFEQGDLEAGIHAAKLYYTLVLNPDHTFTLNCTLKDTYNFEFSFDYYNSSGGLFLTAANNIAWVNQHLAIIDDYKFSAELPTLTGTWQ